MRIGLDIDNVITEFDSLILNEFIKEDKDKRNTGIINPNANHIIDGMFDWTREEILEFFANNMERISLYLTPLKDCKFYMDKLLDKGHEIFLISHRIFPDYKDPYNTTEKWLNKNNINYTKLVLSKGTDKTFECKENKIDIMIDDRITPCSIMMANGINCFVMQTKYNCLRKHELPFVTDWKNLYEELNKMEKQNIILDTDMSNEIDDQFALTYLIKSLKNFNLEAITIAPYLNSGYSKTESIDEGTQLSFNTTLNLLDLLNHGELKDKVYKGATNYFYDNKESNLASDKIIEIALKNELTTIIAIGAITNIAIAIRKNPNIINRIKVVWLGGNSFLSENNNEFNFRQDIEGVKEVFNSKVELVVIPCRNVASNMTTTIYELEHYLKNNGKLGEYLCKIFESCKKSYFKSETDEIGSSKTLWDLSAVAYMINKKWFVAKKVSCPLILDNGCYKKTQKSHLVIFVNDLFRNKIFNDFFIKMNNTN